MRRKNSEDKGTERSSRNHLDERYSLEQQYLECGIFTSLPVLFVEVTWCLTLIGKAVPPNVSAIVWKPNPRFLACSGHAQSLNVLEGYVKRMSFIPLSFLLF